MHATGLVKTVVTCLFVVAGMVLWAPQASAQSGLYDTIYIDGEPTDPEEAHRLLGEAGADLGSPPPAQNEAEFLNWFEELIARLKVLGLVPPGEPGS